MCGWFKIHLNVEQLPMYLFLPRMLQHRTPEILQKFENLWEFDPASLPNVKSEAAGEGSP